jgi:DnaJ-class molecular chaperone
MDYYAILGIDRNAEAEEIRKAYRKLAQLCHPDKSGKEDASRFREIRQAYETLSDPQARAAYDRKLQTGVPIRMAPRRPPADHVEEVFPRRRSRVVEVFPSGSRKAPVADPFQEFDRFFEIFFRRF